MRPWWPLAGSTWSLRTALLPNAALPPCSFVRKEVVLSSQIEGTQYLCSLTCC
jgi:hypothetical protein